MSKHQEISRRKFLAASLAGAAVAATQRIAFGSGAQPSQAQPPGTAASGIKTSPAPASIKKGPQWIKAQPFDLADVKLLDSPFKKARDLDARYLLDLEPDRLLHNFRTLAGLEAKAPIYKGWESAGVAGHVLGHYLSAISLHYRATGDPIFKQRADYIVAELATCQAKNGDGYVSAIPEGRAMFNDVKAGHGNGVHRGWVPWYTMHKLFAGLRDAHLYTDNAQAKDVLVKLSDWTIDTTRNLNEEQWQIMLTQEHGGMNETLADVYALTGEQKYLDLARKFRHKAVLDPLAARKDDLTGLHGNTQIPKLIGLARIYELTGDEKERTAASYFWERVVDTRSYAIGANSDNEHWGAPDDLKGHLGPVAAETCNTYNMLKLTRHLFGWTGDPTYADYYERALYNHILASQDPASGMVTYYVSMKPGHFKTYSTPFDAMWCCVGTGLENHVKYNDSIYFHDDTALYVNLFIPSELNWAAKGLKVRQDTKFPEASTTRLTFTPTRGARQVSAVVKVRCPYWATQGATFKINGKVQKVTTKPGSYATLARAWKSGDVLEVSLPMGIHSETLPGDASKVALLYGPIVLAGQLGREGLPKSLLSGDAGAYFSVPDPAVPVLVSTEPVMKWVQPVKGESLTFRTRGAQLPGQAQASEVTLRPFYQTAHDRYTVYWDKFTPAEWKKQQDEYAAEQQRQRDLQARTVDEFHPGEQQSEVDHSLKSEKSNSGPYQSTHWRDAGDGGWFSFDLKVQPDVAQDLVCTFWGGEVGNRVFDIMVDGRVLGTQKLSNNKPGQFFDVTFPIPADLLQGKTKVTVRLQAKPGAIAGGLFGARVVRRA